jgi:Putative sensor
MKKRKDNFFNVIAKKQTYLNMAYLLLTYILGIFYFTVLVTGISLGFGLVITLIGIPILVGMIFLWRAFAKFEIYQAKNILNINIQYKKSKRIENFWKKIEHTLKDSFTWKSLAYLFIKFPIGIFSFVVLVTLLSVSLSFIAVPFAYYLTDLKTIIFNSGIENFCSINKGFLSIVLGIIGAFLFFVSLHAFNGIAKLSGILAKELLGKNNL